MHDALTLVKAKKSSSWRTTFKLCVECWRRWRVALISYSWGGLWGKNGCLILPGFCMHYHCSTATKLNLIDEMICWSHFIWKNPEASSAQCQLCIYRCLCNISPRNLEPCFLQTLFFNYQFVLLWAYDFDGYRITGVTECSKADWLSFQCGYMWLQGSTLYKRKLSLASKLIHYCWCLKLSPNILHYSISLRNMGNIFEQISLRNISAEYFAQYLSCVISSRNSLA